MLGLLCIFCYDFLKIVTLEFDCILWQHKLSWKIIKSKVVLWPPRNTPASWFFIILTHSWSLLRDLIKVLCKGRVWLMLVLRWGTTHLCPSFRGSAPIGLVPDSQRERAESSSLGEELNSCWNCKDLVIFYFMYSLYFSVIADYAVDYNEDYHYVFVRQDNVYPLICLIFMFLCLCF